MSRLPHRGRDKSRNLRRGASRRVILLPSHTAGATGDRGAVAQFVPAAPDLLLTELAVGWSVGVVDIAAAARVGVMARGGDAAVGEEAAHHHAGGGHAEAGDADVEFEVGKIGERDIVVCVGRLVGEQGGSEGDMVG